MDNSELYNDRFFELLARKKSGEISLAEQKELISLCLQNPELTASLEFMDDVFDADMLITNQPDNEEVIVKWNDFKSRLTGKKKARLYSLGTPLRRIAIVAALLMIMAGIVVFHFTSNRIEKSQAPTNNVVSTKKGSRSNILLPDGTKVYLNADSRITYTEKFATNREVMLSGEAYFDVTKDKEHPFIVHTPVMDIKVIGTAFNVRAYSSENSAQTTLIRGIIEVSLKENKKKIILKPNEKLIIQNEYEQKSVINKTEFVIPKITLLPIKNNIIDTVANDILWTQNKLVFDQTKFSEIVAELERWYNVKIIVQDNSLLGRSFSGIYEDEDIREVLESFKVASGYNYTINNNVVKIFK